MTALKPPRLTVQSEKEIIEPLAQRLIETGLPVRQAQLVKAGYWVVGDTARHDT